VDHAADCTPDRLYRQGTLPHCRHEEAGTGGTVNGKDTSVEVESRPVDVCMYSARTWIGPKVVMGKGIGALRPRLDSAGRGRLVGG